MSRSTLASATLYGILDLGYVSPSQLPQVAGEMIQGGVDVIQLRAKGCALDEIEAWGKAILPMCTDAGVPFILNDYPEMAISIGADGVHVGQDDMTMDAVRAIVGDSLLVGRSTHSLAQAATAAADPRTDYIGFGPLFATPTKPTYQPIGTAEIRAVHLAHPDLPIFCIGGIKNEHLPELLAGGARRVVIVSGILQAANISGYVRIAKRSLTGK